MQDSPLLGAESKRVSPLEHASINGVADLGTPDEVPDDLVERLLDDELEATEEVYFDDE